MKRCQMKDPCDCFTGAGTRVSHSPLLHPVSLSTFELAIIKCACIHCDIWRTKALCKCKCHVCAVTTQRRKVSGELNSTAKVPDTDLSLGSGRPQTQHTYQGPVKMAYHSSHLGQSILSPHLNISLKKDLWKRGRFSGLSSASEFSSYNRTISGGFNYLNKN